MPADFDVESVIAQRRALEEQMTGETPEMLGIAEPERVAQPDDDEFEWMLVEIYGHRSHWGRGKEVERFGAKQLRIDVPTVEWTTPTAGDPTPVLTVTGWVSHFYGGGAIFSHTLTDEATVLRRNAPLAKPERYRLPPPEDDDEEADF